eukprot:Clim_evm25s15 gene=Clim_evmTU25s15
MPRKKQVQEEVPDYREGCVSGKFLEAIDVTKVSNEERQKVKKRRRSKTNKEGDDSPEFDPFDNQVLGIHPIRTFEKEINCASLDQTLDAIKYVSDMLDRQMTAIIERQAVPIGAADDSVEMKDDPAKENEGLDEEDDEEAYLAAADEGSEDDEAL